MLNRRIKIDLDELPVAVKQSPLTVVLLLELGIIGLQFLHQFGLAKLPI